MTNYRIPTREEHQRFIRKVWIWCIIGAILVFAVTGSVTLSLFLAGHPLEVILKVSTTVFQIVVLSYGLGFFVPAFTTSLVKMGLGIEMSRQALEIGQKTAENLDVMKTEVMPIVKDLKDVVHKFSGILENVRDVIQKVKIGDRGLEEPIRNAIREARKAVKDGESEVEKWIFDRVDKFLGDVFGGRDGDGTGDEVGTEKRGTE